jgi:hypothetical protein
MLQCNLTAAKQTKKTNKTTGKWRWTGTSLNWCMIGESSQENRILLIQGSSYQGMDRAESLKADRN